MSSLKSGRYIVMLFQVKHPNTLYYYRLLIMTMLIMSNLPLIFYFLSQLSYPIFIDGRTVYLEILNHYIVQYIVKSFKSIIIPFKKVVIRMIYVLTSVVSSSILWSKVSSKVYGVFRYKPFIQKTNFVVTKFILLYTY